MLSTKVVEQKKSFTFDEIGCWLFTYTISTLFATLAVRAYLPMSGGGAVPGFFLSPFILAVSWVLFTRTSHVGGNSMRHGTVFDRNEPTPE